MTAPDAPTGHEAQGGYWHCGDCGAVFTSEDAVRTHTTTTRDEDGDLHDGNGYHRTSDEIAFVARNGTDAPWSYIGSWNFSGETDFNADESIGWAIRQAFRTGASEVRVLFREDAQHRFDSSRVPRG